MNAALAALAVGVLAHGLHGIGLLGGSDSLFADWLYTSLQWGPRPSASPAS